MRDLLVRYLRPQWPGALTMAVLLLTGIALQLAGPQVVRGFIDLARTGAAESDLLRAGLLYLVLTLSHGAAGALAAYASERVAWTATNALRADLTAHLLRLDLTFHKDRTPGELIERVDGDVAALAGFFSSFVVRLAGSALLLAGVLCTVALVDLRLGLAFTLFALLTLILLGWVRRRGTPHWGADRERSAAFFGFLGEVLGATEDLRASGAVPYVMRRFFEHLRAWLPVRLCASLWGQSVMTAAIAAFAVLDALAYGLGGGLYRTQALTLGEAYLVLAYAAMLAAPIETIRTQLQQFQHADAAITRIRALLHTRSSLAAPPHPVPLPAGPLSVEFQDVSFGYADGTTDPPEPERPPAGTQRAPDPVLHHLSFTLAPGRVLGLLGHTGSGKSTCARLLFRLYDPTAGAIRVGGTDLRHLDLDALRARIGLVTQDVQLFDASLRDNVTLFDPAVSDPRLLALLETLGLGPWLARLPGGLDAPIAAGRLSAGEAQLIALARVFLKDPDLVVLDEASSRLDPHTQALLESALDRLLAGRTAIIIAHRLSTLERADDVLLLQDGRAVEYGPRATLAADPHSHFARLLAAGRQEVLA